MRAGSAMVPMPRETKMADEFSMRDSTGALLAATIPESGADQRPPAPRESWYFPSTYGVKKRARR